MKKYPYVRQIGIKDCGVSCLKMVLQFYGGNESLEKLREYTNTTKEGTSAFDLIKGAKKVGLDAAGYQATIDQIKSNQLPVIAYTIINQTYQHYMVIYEITKKWILVGDPATKLKKMKYSEFQDIYQNVILVFEPLTLLPYHEESSFLKKKITEIMKSQKKYFLLLAILTIIVTLCSIILTLPIRLAVDFTFQNFPVKLYTSFFLILFFQFLSGHFQTKISIWINKATNTQLWSYLMEKILFLPYQYYRNRTTGEILSKVTNIEKVSNFIINTFSNLIINLLIIIFSLILMYIINIKMLFVILILTFFICITTLIYTEKRTSYLTETISNKSIIDSYLYEAISGFETVKGLNIEEETINKLNKKNDNFFKSKNKYSLIGIKEYGLQNLIYIIGNIVFILIGIKFIKNGIMRISDFILFFSLYNNFSEPFMNMIDYIHSFKDVKLSIKCIEDIFIPNINTKEEIPLYDKNTIILGPSGVGKSTLLKKIKGYYSSNNKDIIYISQNEILFTDTIYNNILIGNKNKENLDKVIDICELKSVIESRKLKGNSLIEENGYNLSGGEKQRIILARSIIKKPKLLLIDEGLSEVNIDLERKILKNIMDNYKDMIIIFVSHRKENIDLFENVINLERSLI